MNDKSPRSEEVARDITLDITDDVLETVDEGGEQITTDADSSNLTTSKSEPRRFLSPIAGQPSNPVSNSNSPKQADKETAAGDYDDWSWGEESTEKPKIELTDIPLHSVESSPIPPHSVDSSPIPSLQGPKAIIPTGSLPSSSRRLKKNSSLRGSASTSLRGPGKTFFPRMSDPSKPGEIASHPHGRYSSTVSSPSSPFDSFLRPLDEKMRMSNFKLEEEEVMSGATQVQEQKESTSFKLSDGLKAALILRVNQHDRSELNELIIDLQEDLNATHTREQIDACTSLDFQACEDNNFTHYLELMLSTVKTPDAKRIITTIKTLIPTQPSNLREESALGGTGTKNTPVLGFIQQLNSSDRSSSPSPSKPPLTRWNPRFGAHQTTQLAGDSASRETSQPSLSSEQELAGQGQQESTPAEIPRSSSPNG